jgi:hypothetical protein
MDEGGGQRFGGFWAVLAARLGMLWCAGAALWRAALYFYSEVGGVPLELPVASLTFMPLPDLLFAVSFAALALMIGRPLVGWLVETAFIVCALHIAVLVSYQVIFIGWTAGAALGFDRLSTYLHVVIPVLVCLAIDLRIAQLLWQRWRRSRRPPLTDLRSPS